MNFKCPWCRSPITIPHSCEHCPLCKGPVAIMMEDHEEGPIFFIKRKELIMSDNKIVVKGRYPHRPLNSETMVAEVTESKTCVTIRVDDASNPEFWMEIIVPIIHEEGDIFMINNQYINNPGWVGCCVRAEKIAKWGIQGDILYPLSADEQAVIPIRLEWNVLDFIGRPPKKKEKGNDTAATDTAK